MKKIIFGVLDPKFKFSSKSDVISLYPLIYLFAFQIMCKIFFLVRLVWINGNL